MTANLGTEGTLVAATDSRIRYQGRWDLSGSRATTVSSGSRITLSFTGRRLSGLSDVATITNPPQIYVSIDGGAPAVIWVDRPSIMLASGLRRGTHRADIAVKDVDERANRWVSPLQSGLIVTGYELDPGAELRPLVPDSGPRIEFLGDSITQGVRAVGPQIGPLGADATKDYAWLTGMAFGADFDQVGFGGQGILTPGNGGVPPAPAAFRLNFAGSASETPPPQAVVVNQGTNDAFQGVPSAQFEPAYEAYLRQLRAAWPNTWIFALRPFGGYFEAEIARSVDDLRDPRIVYVDTTGWLTPPDFADGLHPSYAGHTIVAGLLTRVIAAHTGWHPGRIHPAATSLITGFEGSDAIGWEPGEDTLAVAVTSTPPANGAPAYDGTRSLAVTSAVAPLADWREVDLKLDRPLHLSGSARDLFAYVSVAAGSVAAFDARLTVHTTARDRTVTHEGIPNLTPVLAWNRIHLNLDGPAVSAAITGISIAVRGEGNTTTGTLSFQVDDIGWTTVLDG